jgi:hypothetical protein
MFEKRFASIAHRLTARITRTTDQAPFDHHKENKTVVVLTSKSARVRLDAGVSRNSFRRRRSVALQTCISRTRSVMFGCRLVGQLKEMVPFNTEQFQDENLNSMHMSSDILSTQRTIIINEIKGFVRSPGLRR